MLKPIGFEEDMDSVTVIFPAGFTLPYLKVWTKLEKEK